MAYDEELGKAREEKAAFEREERARPADMLRQNESAGGMLASGMPRYDLEHLFRYHPPRHEQLSKYHNIRIAAKHFAEVVLANSIPGADQDAVIRKIREAMMTANASIATSGCGQP